MEKISGLSLDDYQFQFKGKPLEESNHGKKFTLQDHKIDKEDTLFLMKLGFVLNITQPMVIKNNTCNIIASCFNVQ